MTQNITPHPAYLRTRAVHQYLVDTLLACLPRPQNDTPEERRRRDEAAIAQVAALNPANAVEVGFAAQWVAASAHARECLRRANHPDTDIATSRKYTTQSVSMTRQSQGTLRTLHALRADREKRAATARAKYETASSRTNILAFPKHNRASRPPES